MNDFYISVAEQIGNDQDIPKSTDFSSTEEFVATSIAYHKNHSSSDAITNNCKQVDNFTFSTITPHTAETILKTLDTKKATGVDNIPPKALKVASDILAYPLTTLFNSCVKTNSFHKGAKLAQVPPIFKKQDPLEKKNYRPVSILTTISKALEKLLEMQLKNGLLNDIYNDGLSAFRSGYSCQHVLINISESWRKAIENKQKCGLLLVDLSKAFDCLPHSLIISKLHSYTSPLKLQIFWQTTLQIASEGKNWKCS